LATIFVSYVLCSLGTVIGGFLFFFALLAFPVAFAVQRLAKWKGWSPRLIDSAAALFYSSAGIVFGEFMYIQGNQIASACMFSILICGIIGLYSLEVGVSRKAEKMKIVVAGNYSPDFVHFVVKRIEDVLSEKRMSYERTGTEIQVKLPEKEQILITMDGDVYEPNTEYVLILSTKRPKSSPAFADLKREISGIIWDIEHERGIESFRRVKSAVCRRCGRNGSYILKTDEFYCRRCHNVDGMKDFIITYEDATEFA